MNFNLNEAARQLEIVRSTELNFDEAYQFMRELLGQEKGMFRSFPPKGSVGTTYMNHSPKSLSTEIEAFTELNNKGQNIFVVPNGQSQWDKSIIEGHRLFYEIDTIPVEEQYPICLDRLGIEPTMVVFTGNKSLHTYINLDKPLAIHLWKELEEDLVASIKEADGSVKNPAQLLRLPGFRHAETGFVANIVSHSGKKYSYEELRAIIPRSSKAKAPVVTVEYPFVADDSDYPDEVAGNGKPVDYDAVFKQLPPDFQNEVRNGVEIGMQDATANKIANQLAALYQNTKGSATAAKFIIAEFFSNCEQDTKAPFTDEDVKRHWKSATSQKRDLLFTKAPKKTLIEKVQAIEEFYKGKLKQDCVSLDAIQPWGANYKDKYAYLYFAEDLGIELSPKYAADVLSRMLEANQYNGVTDYLDTLPEVGVDLASSTLFDLFKLRLHIDDDLKIRAAIMWMVGAVKRMYEPGCRFDLMLILKGAQLTGKSSFFKILADKYFIEAKGMDSSKRDVFTKYHKNWIVEVDECDKNLRTRETGITKSAITTAVDVYRGMYAINEERYPRKFVFGGTTNTEEVFLDQTGNRRYVLLNTGEQKIDCGYVEENRDLIWSCAKALYLAKHPTDLDDELLNHINAENENNLVTDARLADLPAWLEGKENMMFKGKDLMFKCFEYDAKTSGYMQFQTKVYAELNRLGWENKVRKINGKPIKLWARVGAKTTELRLYAPYDYRNREMAALDEQEPETCEDIPF